MGVLATMKRPADSTASSKAMPAPSPPKHLPARRLSMKKVNKNAIAHYISFLQCCQCTSHPLKGLNRAV